MRGSPDGISGTSGALTGYTPVKAPMVAVFAMLATMTAPAVAAADERPLTEVAV